MTLDNDPNCMSSVFRCAKNVYTSSLLHAAPVYQIKTFNLGLDYINDKMLKCGLKTKLI